MNMRVQREQPRRRVSYSCLGCGAVALIALIGVVAVGVFLVVTYLPNIALQAAGFQAAGNTDAVFQAPPAATPLPIVVVATIPPSEVVISAGDLGERTLDVPPGAVQIESGQVAASGDSAVSQDVLRVTVDEAGMLDICRQYSPICTPSGDSRLRNVMFDLRPGGAVVNGDFYLAQLGSWQTAGVVMRLNAANRLEVIGVDVGGMLYSAPPGEMSDLVQEAETRANELLQQLAVQTGGTRYAVRSITIDDGTLTMIMQA